MQESKQELITREPVVAGQFYPGNPEELKAELSRLFALAVTKKTENCVRAVIAPHAGYVFSGELLPLALTNWISIKNIKPSLLLVQVTGCRLTELPFITLEITRLPGDSSG